MAVTATLGDLHNVIQVLFGWDGDHPHEFRVGKKRYCDLFTPLEGAEDEDEDDEEDATEPEPFDLAEVKQKALGLGLDLPGAAA